MLLMFPIYVMCNHIYVHNLQIKPSSTYTSESRNSSSIPGG